MLPAIAWTGDGDGRRWFGQRVMRRARRFAQKRRHAKFRQRLTSSSKSFCAATAARLNLQWRRERQTKADLQSASNNPLYIWWRDEAYCDSESRGL